MTAANPESAPKILQIGEVPLMREAYPDTTTFFSTEAECSFPLGPQDRVIGAGSLARLRRHLADPSFDLIVVQPTAFAPWSGEAFVRAVFRRRALRGVVPLLRGVGQELIRGKVAAPVAMWDPDDPPFMPVHNLFLLDRATLFFKRELPVDHWRVFMNTAHGRLPTARFRARERNRARVAKLRPVPLGIPLGRLGLPTAKPLPASGKSVDIFFTGRAAHSSTLRARGLAEVLALRDKGLRVDIPDNTLPLEDFLARCARAWLVWSPEGYGWETFRTYETALCGSVAVINSPTIERHKPLRDGVHAFYYDAEPGELTRVIKAALADRDRLARMGLAARELVLAEHTPAAVARYMARETLSAARRAAHGEAQ